MINIAPTDTNPIEDLQALFASLNWHHYNTKSGSSVTVADTIHNDKPVIARMSYQRENQGGPIMPHWVEHITVYYYPKSEFEQLNILASPIFTLCFTNRNFGFSEWKNIWFQAQELCNLSTARKILNR